MSPIAAETASTEVPQPQAAAEVSTGPRQPLRAQLADILGSVRRLADLQLGIWMARTKLAVLRMVLCALCALLALVLTIVALLFLYAGIYHIVTDILMIPTPWALLMFAGVHILLAGILALAGVVIFTRRHKQPGAAA